MQKIKEKVEKNANYETLTKDSKIPKKKFKSGIDDCAKNLHPARWLRYPVTHPKKFLKKMPVVRTPAYRNMELEFFGFNGRVADRTIVSLHDRAVPLQIKHFLSENCSVTSKPRKEIKRLEEEGLSSTIDFSWENPSNMTQIQEGFNNYKFLLYLIWPTDPTGMIMHNVLSTYKWAAGAGDQRTRQTIVTSYFNTALRDNAGRATNKQLVMSFKEHERIFKDCMIKMNVRPEIPLMSHNNQTFQQGNQSNASKPFQSNSQNGNKQGNQIKKRAMVNGSLAASRTTRWSRAGAAGTNRPRRGAGTTRAGPLPTPATSGSRQRKATAWTAISAESTAELSAIIQKTFSYSPSF